MKAHVQKTNCPAEKSSTSFARKNTAVGPASAFAQETEALDETSARHGTPRGHDFSQIPVFSKTPVRLQTKLTVNTPGDIYEQEADRVAEQVMRGPKAQGRLLGNRQLQAKSLPAGGPEGIEAPPIVGEVLGSPGQPLDARTRAFMEPRFGHDFSRVRIHANSQAAEAARSVHAKGFTVGSQIAFGRGEWSPHSSSGQRLLAHELAHVIQQGGQTIRVMRQSGNDNSDEASSGSQAIAGLDKNDVEKPEDEEIDKDRPKGRKRAAVRRRDLKSSLRFSGRGTGVLGGLRGKYVSSWKWPRDTKASRKTITLRSASKSPGGAWASNQPFGKIGDPGGNDITFKIAVSDNQSHSTSSEDSVRVSGGGVR